jgi:hypothetical protein
MGTRSTINFESIMLYIRSTSSVVACYLVINTILSFVSITIISKCGNDSYLLKVIIFITLCYLIVTYIDICSSAKADFSFLGVIKGCVAALFMLLLFAAFYYGVVNAAMVDDYIHPVLSVK